MWLSFGWCCSWCELGCCAWVDDAVEVPPYPEHFAGAVLLWDKLCVAAVGTGIFWNFTKPVGFLLEFTGFLSGCHWNLL